MFSINDGNQIKHYKVGLYQFPVTYGQPGSNIAFYNLDGTWSDTYPFDVYLDSDIYEPNGRWSNNFKLYNNLGYIVKPVLFYSKDGTVYNPFFEKNSPGVCIDFVPGTNNDSNISNNITDMRTLFKRGVFYKSTNYTLYGIAQGSITTGSHIVLWMTKIDDYENFKIYTSTATLPFTISVKYNSTLKWYYISLKWKNPAIGNKVKIKIYSAITPIMKRWYADPYSLFYQSDNEAAFTESIEDSGQTYGSEVINKHKATIPHNLDSNIETLDYDNQIDTNFGPFLDHLTTFYKTSEMLYYNHMLASTYENWYVYSKQRGILLKDDSPSLLRNDDSYSPRAVMMSRYGEYTFTTTSNYQYLNIIPAISNYLEWRDPFLVYGLTAFAVALEPA